MAEQERRLTRQHREREAVQVEEVQTNGSSNGHKSGEELKTEIDDLLDEIDGVLEENAEDFVKAFVQKGGQ